MKVAGYQAVVERYGSEFVASVPALPGCVVVGDTKTVALAQLSEAIAGWARMARRLGHPVPEAQP